MVSFARKEVKSLQGLLYIVAVCLFAGNVGEVMKAHMQETFSDLAMADLFKAEPLNEPSARALLGAPTERLEPINYLRESETTVKVFKDCTADPNCHFTYHHVSKTGGTTIEENMYPKFAQPIQSTCCHGRILKEFRADPEHYCAQKFTSWQVSKGKFIEIVNTCRRLRPNSRTVVWTTFREPISTFVSLVHQMCNKNVNKRDPDKHKACEVCDYNNETAAVWLEYAQSVEWQIKGAYNTSHFFLDAPDVTTVTMEPSDLNGFWQEYTNTTLHSSNSEKLSLCSFRPTSHLVKALREAQNVYRHLVAGLEVEKELLNHPGILPD
jgi:hypothetical protein